MKKYGVLSVMVIALIIGFSSKVFSLENSEINGEWNLVLSGQSIGTLQLDINGTDFTGYVDTVDSYDWAVENGQIINESKKMYIRFERGSGERQIYHGWIRADGAYIAGYFQYGDKEQPWYATRKKAQQDEYSEAYEAGKQFCIENPEKCGININGGCTQAELDIKYQEGCETCSNSSGTLSTISPELNMHIPALQYQTLLGNINLWADFEFAGESNGDMLWKLSDFGEK